MATETSTRSFDISGYVTRTTGGTIDVQDTHSRFTKDLAALVNSERSNNDVIAKSVEKAFADNTTSTLSMGQVLHYSMQNLQVSSDKFNTVREQVANYIRHNTRHYKVSKGKGGGVTRLEQTVPPTLPPPPSSSGTMRLSARV